MGIADYKDIIKDRPDQKLPAGTFVVGNKLFGVCPKCQSIVRLDKPILGSLHICQ